jgi:hypothetical protein
VAQAGPVTRRPWLGGRLAAAAVVLAGAGLLGVVATSVTTGLDVGDARPAAAQETTVPPGAVPPDAVPTTDAGPTTVIPTAPPPTTAPPCTPAPGEADVVFLGIMLERDGDVVRFDVRSVQQGPELPTVVGVAFPGEAQYFDEGSAYRVVASPTPEGRYAGRIRQPEGQCLPLTVTAGGDPLDTSMFGRLAGEWPRILWAFFVPFVAVLVVLAVVVALKRLVVWAFR